MGNQTVNLKESSRIDKLLEESLNLRVSNIHLAIEKSEKALESSKATNYLKGKAYAHSYLAFFYMIITNHKEAIPHIDAALDYFKKVNDKFGLAFNYNTYGSIQYKTNDYHMGLKHLLQAYELYKEINDVQNQSRTLKNIGSVYEFFKDYEKAKETYLKCVSLSESIDDYNGISNALNPLSGLFLKENDIDNAFKTVERSILLKEQTGDQRGLGFAIYGRGKINDSLENFDKAEDDYLKSLDIHLKLAEHVGAMMTLNKLGNMYIKFGKPDLAKKRLQECLVEGKTTHHNLIIYKAYYALYAIAKKEGNNKEALAYLEKYDENKERVQKRDVDNVLRSVQAISKIEMLENEAIWHKEKTEEVEKKNKELDNFVYKVSHDLRGPISSLLGLHNVVKLDITDKTSLKYFDLYHEQIKRLDAIILDFITLTRLKESKTEKSLINFEAIIEQCIKAYSYLPNFNSIAIETKIDKSISFQSDKSSINSILQNLIENAIKYANVKRVPFVNINVSWVNEEKQIKIVVEDNGVGIQDEFKTKIFDMFFRANSNIQGSGLGLYILKTAVDRLQGKVQFTSKYQQGSKFIVTLPI